MATVPADKPQVHDPGSVSLSLEDLFTLSKEITGDRMDPGMGESTKVFAQQEVRRFYEEL